MLICLLLVNCHITKYCSTLKKKKNNLKVSIPEQGYRRLISVSFQLILQWAKRWGEKQ